MKKGIKKLLVSIVLFTSSIFFVESASACAAGSHTEIPLSTGSYVHAQVAGTGLSCLIFVFLSQHSYTTSGPIVSDDRDYDAKPYFIPVALETELFYYPGGYVNNWTHCINTEFTVTHVVSVLGNTHYFTTPFEVGEFCYIPST